MAKFGTTEVTGAQVQTIDMHGEVHLIRQKKRADRSTASGSGHSDTDAAASPSVVPVASRVVVSITFAGPPDVWERTLRF